MRRKFYFEKLSTSPLPVALVPVGRRKRTESMSDQNSPIRCRLTDTQKVLAASTLQEQATGKIINSYSRIDIEKSIMVSNKFS